MFFLRCTDFAEFPMTVGDEITLAVPKETVQLFFQRCIQFVIKCAGIQLGTA